MRFALIVLSCYCAFFVLFEFLYLNAKTIQKKRGPGDVRPCAKNSIPCGYWYCASRLSFYRDRVLVVIGK